MDYLRKYGKKKRIFQEGGAMAAPAPAQEAGPSGDEVIALAQAAISGDQAAAAQLGMMLAPLILEQAGAGGGEAMAGQAPEAAPAPVEGEPVFRKGGSFLRRA